MSRRRRWSHSPAFQANGARADVRDGKKTPEPSRRVVLARNKFPRGGMRRCGPISNRSAPSPRN